MDVSKYLDYRDHSHHHAIDQNIRAETRAPEFNSAFRYIYDHIPVLGDNTLLDVGPAGGYAMHKMQQRGFTVRGVSIIEKDIEAIKEKGFDGEVCDMHNLPCYANGTFSHVLMSHVLEHSPAPFIALKEAYRILKDPGLLALVLPPWDGNISMKIDGEIVPSAPTWHSEGHFFNVPHQGVKTMLKKVGFTILKYEEVPHFTIEDGKKLIQYHHEFYLAYRGPIDNILNDYLYVETKK